MNYSQLRQSTLTRIGVSSNDALFTATVVGDLVNEAIHTIEVEFDWPWLEAITTHSTTAGTQTLTVPTDWLRTDKLWIADNDPLEYLGFGDLRQQYDVTGRGQPEAYSIVADAIYLGPTPDSTYTVNHLYIRREPDLTSDTDSPLMPASFHMAIVELATALGLRRSREEARAVVAENSYNNWLRRMADNRRRSSQPMRVRVRPGRQF